LNERDLTTFENTTIGINGNEDEYDINLKLDITGQGIELYDKNKDYEAGTILARVGGIFKINESKPAGD
jgi:hypothetical protein